MLDVLFLLVVLPVLDLVLYGCVVVLGLVLPPIGLIIGHIVPDKVLGARIPQQCLHDPQHDGHRVEVLPVHLVQHFRVAYVTLVFFQPQIDVVVGM
jgi:hypothetical protein